MAWGKSVLATFALACLASAVAWLAVTAVRPASAPAPQPPKAVASSKKPSTPVLGDFTGHWADSANAPRPVMGTDGMDQIDITAMSNSTVTFDVMHTGHAPGYRIIGSDATIIAPIVGHVARFRFLDDRGNLNQGTIEFLKDKLVVEIDRAQTSNPTANVSIAMNCVMLRDQYYATRTVAEPQYDGPFIGVTGEYSRSSGVPDDPVIKIVSVDREEVRLDIVWGYQRGARVDHLRGTVTGKSEVAVPYTDSDVTLSLSWENPGTITVSCPKGTPSARLRTLLEYPTYWNSQYLHTS